MDLGERVERDKANAIAAQSGAQAKLQDHTHFRPVASMGGGVPVAQLDIAEGLSRARASLEAIAMNPFDAMIEADVQTQRGSSHVVWYANERTTTNELLVNGSGAVHVMAWTHPAVQLALSAALGKRRDVESYGYTLRSIKPIARGRFSRVVPSISGLYEPGGRVHEKVEAEDIDIAGLKAVKLAMTEEQVDAFISRMDGFLLISGAPGTGKTTVAFQRIRFLFDQQSERLGDGHVRYDPARTRVFLANPNLIEYSRNLLVSELDVPADVVLLIPHFISTYVDEKWQHKGHARLRTREIANAEKRAREALFNLCKPRELSALWRTFENQIRERLASASNAGWITVAQTVSDDAAAAAARLAEEMQSTVSPADGPQFSQLRMDAIFQRVRRYYDACRGQFVRNDRPLEEQRTEFDASFARWLFYVYDPLDAIATYFVQHRNEGVARIKSGTGELLSADTIINDVVADWAPSSAGVRQYGLEEQSWIAWLLRFALPESHQQNERFRDVPNAFPADGPRWTHVVIDEAQDLAVQEASFLASLAHPRGSTTVSADFRQVVSPVHGMEDATALTFGLPMRDAGTYSQFPFKRNMRQSREIGAFLQAFYQVAFQEFAPFDAGDRGEGKKPSVYTGNASLYPRLIAQMMAVLRTSSTVRSIALLQIDDDVIALKRLHDALQKEHVELAAVNDLSAPPGKLVTSSVERAKGLEFDACIVVGLDDIERASLNFSKNRAYVALSRPTQRLFMLCQQFPPILRKIPSDLYEHRALK